MTVYNEADFVDYAIRSCLPYVDDLVIVEGAYLENIKLGKSPRSTDGTLEIIEKYRNNEKVHIIYANEKSDPQQRNIGLDKAKELGSDWILIIDGDEVYTPQTLTLIRHLINKYDKENIRAAYFQSMTFVNNPDSYTLQEFPRLFKATPDATFVNDNFINWGTLGWSTPHVIKNLNVKYHHYSFLKGVKKLEDKRNWWMNRGLGKEFDYGWHIDENGKIYDANHKIYKFTGTHPKIMVNHPMFKENKDV
jgi:glycosyltransferase involved in cell wall biosynthesis